MLFFFSEFHWVVHASEMRVELFFLLLFVCVCVLTFLESTPSFAERNTDMQGK
jgi:hypothetical protein